MGSEGNSVIIDERHVWQVVLFATRSSRFPSTPQKTLLYNFAIGDGAIAQEVNRSGRIGLHMRNEGCGYCKGAKRVRVAWLPSFTSSRTFSCVYFSSSRFSWTHSFVALSFIPSCIPSWSPWFVCFWTTRRFCVVENIRTVLMFFVFAVVYSHCGQASLFCGFRYDESSGFCRGLLSFRTFEQRWS